MANQTGGLDNPVGLGINGLDDAPQETQPALQEAQGEADDFVAEENTNDPGQHNETLEVLIDNTLAPQGQDDSQPNSAFSFSSSENDEDADDEGAEEEGEGEGEGEEEEEEEGKGKGKGKGGEDEADDATDLTFYASNSAWVQPREEPIRPVVSFANDDEIYRPNPHAYAVLYHKSDSDCDSEDRQKWKEDIKKAAPTRVARPSPLRTASSPDSPVSPKGTESTGNIGVLPEPSPEPHEEDAISPLSDREANPRPHTPTPRAPSNFASGFNWAEEDEEDTSWFDDAVQTPTGSRRGSDDNSKQSSTEHERSVDEGDEALSDQQLPSPVNLSPDDVDDTSHDPESSGLDLHTSQQTAAAPESFAPVFDGVEQDVPPTEMRSPTSPDPTGPEPLTGLTPQEGLAAWWAWRDRNQPLPRTFRTNRNLENQDKKGDLTPKSDRGDTTEALDYLNAQRLLLKEQAKHSRDISNAIRFDLDQTNEYIRLQMLKYRSQRNKYFYQAFDSQERVNRRDQRISELDASLNEAARAYNAVRADHEKMLPVLQQQMAERKRLQAAYNELSEMSEGYRRAAMMSGDDLRKERAKNEEQAERAEQDKQAKRAKQAKQAKQTAPTRLSSFMEVLSQNPVSESSEKWLDHLKYEPWPSDSTPPLFSMQQLAVSTPRPIRPAPEQAANWPLEDRAHLVDFMTSWINTEREGRIEGETPLQKAQLDKILDAGFLSWDQLIEQLGQLGYVVRPHRLASALSDPDNVVLHRLPQPNAAVLYAARRLSKEDDVERLLKEVWNLQKELGSVKMPVTVLTDLKNMQLDKEQHLKEIEELSGKISSLLERNDILKAAPSISNGNGNGNGDPERAALQAELEETQQALAEVLTRDMGSPTSSKSSEFPISPKSPKSPQDDDLLPTIKSQLAACHEHGTKPETEKDNLADELSACQEHSEQLNELCTELRTKIVDLEAELAAYDNNQPDRGKSGSMQVEALDKRRIELERLLAASRIHSEQLQTRKDEIEVELEVQGMQKQGDAGANSDLSDCLEAAEQHARDLQDAIDRSQAEADAAETTPRGDDATIEKIMSELKAAKKDRDDQIALNKLRDVDNAVLQNQLDASRKEVEALREKAKSRKTPGSAVVDKLQSDLELARKMREEARAGLTAANDYNDELEEEVERLQSELDKAQDESKALREKTKSHNSRSVSPDPAVKEPEEDIETLKNELAETRKMNEQLEQDKSSLQSDLGEAQDELEDLREQVELESRQDSEAAPEHDSDSLSRAAENDNASLQSEGAQTAFANGSVADLEEFVAAQSDSESGEKPGEDSKDDDDLDWEETLSPATRERIQRGYAREFGLEPEDVSDLASGEDLDLKSSKDAHARSPSGEAASSSSKDSASSDDVDFVTDSAIPHPTDMSEEVLSHASPEMPPVDPQPEFDPHSLLDSPVQSPSSIELDLASPVESENKVKKRADDLATANKWLRHDSKAAYEEIESLRAEIRELRRSVLARGLRLPLPATREPVPLPGKSQQPPTVPDTRSATRIAREAAMRQSPLFIANTKRRRVIRERQFAEQRAMIIAISQRVAAMFGEEDLPYVPVEERWTKMETAQ